MGTKKTITNFLNKNDKYIFAAVLGLFFLLTFILVYNQGKYSDVYISDITPYIEEALGKNYRFNFPYPIFFKSVKLLSYIVRDIYISAAIIIALCNTLSMFLIKKEIWIQTGEKILSSIAAAILFFVSMIYSRVQLAHGFTSIYAGVFSPNPWQNATYMAARPFMILAFIYGAYTTQNYVSDLKSGFIIKRYILFSLFLLLATMTKPAYTLPHMFSVFVIVMYRLIKSHGETFETSFKLAIFYVPTICALLYQYSGVFTGVSYTGEDNGIGISLGRAWSIWTDHIFLAILMAAAFPLIVLLFHHDFEKESFQYIFGWMIYLMGLLMALFLYEKGFREQDFNFGWGYICGLFFTFFVGLVSWIKDIQMVKKRPIEGVYFIRNKLELIIESLLLFIHFILGLIYFAFIFMGGCYY